MRAAVNLVNEAEVQSALAASSLGVLVERDYNQDGTRREHSLSSEPERALHRRSSNAHTRAQKSKTQPHSQPSVVGGRPKPIACMLVPPCIDWMYGLSFCRHTALPCGGGLRSNTVFRKNAQSAGQQERAHHTRCKVRQRSRLAAVLSLYHRPGPR